MTRFKIWWHSVVLYHDQETKISSLDPAEKFFAVTCHCGEKWYV